MPKKTLNMDSQNDITGYPEEDQPEKKTLYIPLKRQLVLLVTLLILLVTVVFFICLSFFSRYQTEDMERTLRTYSSQVAQSVTDAYASYESIAYSIAYDQAVQQYLLSDSPSERYQNYQTLNAQLTKMSTLNSYIGDIAIYGSDGAFASLNGTRQDYEQIWNRYKSRDIPYQAAGTATVAGNSCHILMMPIYTMSSQGSFSKSRYLGALFIAVDLNSLLSNTAQMVESFSPQILFTDTDGNLIYGDEALYEPLSAQLDDSLNAAVTQISAGDTVYTYTEYSIPTSSNILYVLVDTNVIQSRTMSLGLRLLVFSTLILCIVIILLFVLYLPMIRSIMSITDFMNRVSSGDQRLTARGVTLPPHYIESTEIRDIAAALNNLLTETKKLNHRIFDNYTKMYQLEEENKAAEIAYLRSQINPHFLYNTLTMICGMASEHDDDKIVDVTNALSQIFRYSIKGSDMVPLGQEMEIVRSYLMIQKERFGDRFTVHYEIPPEDCQLIIPKMIIEPLAENAIVHGLEHRKNGGELIIGTERHEKENFLSIFVYDSGTGMSAVQLEKLREEIASALSPTSPSGFSEHIGIRNVNYRLVLYYGQDYHLRIDSEQDEGTNVEIRIPLDQQSARKVKEQNVYGNSN